MPRNFMTDSYTPPRWALSLLNNIYEMERKLALHGDAGNARRNIEKIKDIFAEEIFTREDSVGNKGPVAIFYEDPLGQEFKETRTDLEATISGSGTENLVVVEVLKPIIRIGDKAFSKVIQRGIVIVASKEEGKET